jgi:ubiquinone/menaquinone biosynthesis C-methylase UbiE
MAESQAPIPSDGFAQLHPRAIEDPTRILRLLERLRDERIELRGARHRSDEPETAWIEKIERDSLWLRVRDLGDRPHLLLNFALGETPYFLSCARVGKSDQGRVAVGIPSRIYQAERRDRTRRQSAGDPGVPTRVALEGANRPVALGQIADYSPDGLGLILPVREADALASEFQLRFLDGAPRGEQRWARVRHRKDAIPSPGWVRLGLTTSSASLAEPARVDHRDAILPGGVFTGLRRRAEVLAAGARLATSQGLERILRRAAEPAIRVIDYPNEAGERLRAIVDSWGDPREATAVIIPPAWGRTKETLLPLAATIVASFRRSGLPVVVVRFDGVRKRGESHNDLECRAPGHENHHFTISQGARDILATLDFLEHSPDFGTSRAVLVTFSAASIEGRRAMVNDGGRRLQGWVSVVGAPDLQSGLRRVSGGIDYVRAAEAGIRFGIQELMGVVADMDHIMGDALEQKLAFLEDARREMAGIQQAVTWIHGRYDAWLELDRVREIMACGRQERRRLIEVPTGHQLRSSREAIEVFQLVASEIGSIATGRVLEPALPDLAVVERRRRAERARLPKRTVDLRAFWHDYLLGREGTLGIELMNAIEAYEELMVAQIDALALREGNRVADLGAGTGPFALQLASLPDRPRRLRVDAVDYVQDALLRARELLNRAGDTGDPAVRYLVADLDQPDLPLASNAYDAVLASLVLSYVKDPEALLRCIFDLLRPGGRVVVSTLRRDADISKLYMEGVEELQSGRGRRVFTKEEGQLMDESVRVFLNDAARVLDFEEEGSFRFWDTAEIERLVGSAGFRDVQSRPVFGEPPQAVVVSARRP